MNYKDLNTKIKKQQQIINVLVEQMVLKYLSKLNHFTWYVDIAENTIWCLKDAQYFDFDDTIDIVKQVISKLEKENIVVVEDSNDAYPKIYKNYDYFVDRSFS